MTIKEKSEIYPRKLFSEGDKFYVGGKVFKGLTNAYSLKKKIAKRLYYIEYNEELDYENANTYFASHYKE